VKRYPLIAAGFALFGLALVVGPNILTTPRAEESAEAANNDAAFYSAGMKAGFMCSGVFIAGRAPEDILREELGVDDPLLKKTGDPIVDYEAKSVTCEVGKGRPPRLAVYRDGYGCTLLPRGSSLADTASLPQTDIPMAQGDPATIAWPDGDLLTDQPIPAEVNRAKLDAIVEAAFRSAPDGEKKTDFKTLGVVVVYKDQIIAERYAPGWGVHTQYRSWSSAKSITNALVGIVVGQGKLNVSDPAPIAHWQGPHAGPRDPRTDITIENLLHMSSGLKSPGAFTTHGYWGGVDTARRAASYGLAHPPGRRWKYSNYDTLLLVRSVRHALGDDADAYARFPRVALLNKIGMRDTVPEIDPFGNFILSSQVYTTPRDLARLGLLYLHDGVWQGERILPEGWVDYTATPAPAKKVRDKTRGYGAQFWLMNNFPGLPADTFTTSGSRGQLSTIVPSRDLVVARMGLDPRVMSGWHQEDFVADILGAIDEL